MSVKFEGIGLEILELARIFRDWPRWTNFDDSEATKRNQGERDSGERACGEIRKRDRGERSQRERESIHVLTPVATPQFRS